MGNRDKVMMHINKIKKEVENLHAQIWNKTDIQLKRKNTRNTFLQKGTKNKYALKNRITVTCRKKNRYGMKEGTNRSILHMS
jgi:hypothetical protein